jgi:AcrR family transcriptional regulator
MENRTNILDCALKLFTERGYDAVGVQEFVEAAGVTKPTLYHYFTNKRGLLNALLERGFKDLLDEVGAAAARYQGDLAFTLENIVKTHFQFARANPLFYRMQLTMYFASPGSEPNQLVKRFSMVQYQIVEKVFIQAVVNYGNTRGRHQALAATFIGMINTYIGMFLNGYVELTDELAYLAVRQFTIGIFS